jgi:hypothetical protein
VNPDPFSSVEPRYAVLLEEALMLLERNARPEDPEKLRAAAASEVPERMDD